MITRLKDTLLLVGDMESDRASLRDIFSSTYNLLEAENSNQACMLLKQNSHCIAAVLADIPLSDHGEGLFCAECENVLPISILCVIILERCC